MCEADPGSVGEDAAQLWHGREDAAHIPIY